MHYILLTVIREHTDMQNQGTFIKMWCIIYIKKVSHTYLI